MRYGQYKLKDLVSLFDICKCKKYFEFLMDLGRSVDKCPHFEKNTQMEIWKSVPNILFYFEILCIYENMKTLEFYEIKQTN